MRCDGLVVSTPRARRATTSPTAGPVLAWGVEGFVVSFIAPHSLTARALVVAPDDSLTINNASRGGARGASTSTGARVTELPAGEDIHVEFVRTRACSPSCRARASTTGCASGSAGSRADSVPILLQTPGSVGAAGILVQRARRAARREPPADRAGRAAARPGADRADGGDGGGQDRARPRAGPPARRPAAGGDRAPGRRRGVRRGRVRRSRRAARASWASGCRTTRRSSCWPAA